MDRRSSVVGGLVLIVLGALFLMRSWLPFDLEWGWPLYVIGAGLLFFLAAVITSVGALAIPACIIGGIGGLFYYQYLSGDWESWAYVWTLIPGFVGIGVVLASLLTPGRRIDHSGWVLVGVSVISFVIFGGMIVFSTSLDKYWPVLLIIIGVLIALRALTNRGRI